MPHPAPDPPPLRLATFLPYRFSIVAERLSRHFADSYERSFGLSIPEWRVMAVLGEHGPLPTQRVIETTQMDRVRVSRAVIRLADKSLLARTIPPTDKRAQHLDLTDAGRHLYARIVPLAHRLQTDLAACLEPGERAILDRILDKLFAATAPDIAP